MTWNPEKDDIFKEFAMTPDRELLVWEDWVRIRREEVVKLGIHTMRDPIDLEMNTPENFRGDKERKMALEHAQDIKKPVLEDSVFGKATRLKQRCPCDNVYELDKSAAKPNSPNIIEHVRSPDYIRETEKGLFGYTTRIPCNQLDSDYFNYRYEREKALRQQIKKVYPGRPDMSELVVIGQRPRTPPRKIPPLPQIVVTEPLTPFEDTLTGVYVLRINNTVILKNIPDQSVPEIKRIQKEPWQEFCTSWTYYFNVPETKIGRSKLFLENLGTVTLRYCWKKLKKMIPFIPEEVFEQKFFFNKSEDVIFPGQKKTLYFTFVSHKAGIYNESWELSIMNICLFDMLSDKFVVHLIGDSVENVNKITKKITKLQNRIDRKATEKFLFQLFDDLIIQATCVEPQIYPYKKLLLEAELFIAKNPVCFYHQTEVQKMKDLYKEMTNKEWDLSMSSWRDAMISKDFDERIMYYDSLKTSYRLLLKPWYEGDSLQVEKHRAVKLLLGQLLDKFSYERARVAELNGVEPHSAGDAQSISTPIQESPLTPYIVQNVFYLRMSIHVADFIESIAGVISSIDLNRWIDFDFCQL